MSLAAVAIVLAVFNVITFVLPFNRSGSYWIGYGFTMLAILLTAGVGLYALGREGLKSKFYGMSIVLVAWTYLIVQAIAGVVEMVIFTIPYQYTLVINIVMLGACLIGLIGVNMGKEEIERIEAKVNEKVFFIKSLQGDVEGLASRASDGSLIKALKELADTIRYSDPMSSPLLATIENKIEIKTATLAEAVEADDAVSAKGSIDELQQLFAERNRKCKSLKQ